MRLWSEPLTDELPGCEVCGTACAACARRAADRRVRDAMLDLNDWMRDTAVMPGVTSWEIEPEHDRETGWPYLRVTVWVEGTYQRTRAIERLIHAHADEHFGADTVVVLAHWTVFA